MYAVFLVERVFFRAPAFCDSVFKPLHISSPIVVETAPVKFFLIVLNSSERGNISTKREEQPRDKVHIRLDHAYNLMKTILALAHAAKDTRRGRRRRRRFVSQNPLCTSHLDPTKLAWPSLLSLTGNKVGKSVFLSLSMCTIACRLRSENVPLPTMGEGVRGSHEHGIQNSD